MTRIEFKLKKPYGAYGKIHFQTATRLSKKKKKKRNAKPYKKKTSCLSMEQKKEKKTKTLKPKPYFPIKIQTHSAYRFLAAPSNTQIGLACSNLSNTNPL